MIDIKGTNVTIMVKDMDLAIKFYQNIGFTIKNRWDNHYAMLSVEGLTIGLHPTTKTELSSGSISIGMMIDEINSAKELLSKNEIEHKFETGKSGNFVYFNDLDGTDLYFMQPMWQ